MSSRSRSVDPSYSTWKRAICFRIWILEDTKTYRMVEKLDITHPSDGLLEFVWSVDDDCGGLHLLRERLTSTWPNSTKSGRQLLLTTTLTRSKCCHISGMPWYANLSPNHEDFERPVLIIC